MKRDPDGTGIVFGIQRFSIHDGPGIRTTVFLKGCNLRCAWCHNPEGIRAEPVIGYHAQKCLHCGACVSACSQSCHEMVAGRHGFARSGSTLSGSADGNGLDGCGVDGSGAGGSTLDGGGVNNCCTVCGSCVEVCPAGALELIGKRMRVRDVMDVVQRDQRYYEADGGITLSGGEALLQKDFALALLAQCGDAGIHRVLETNGVHPFETLLEVMPQVDLFLYDYKVTDPEVHRELVGCDNRIVRDNLTRLHDAGAKILVRCPIIPGVNDNEAHFAAIAQLTKVLPNLTGVEILPYHNLGVSKAERIDMPGKEFDRVSTEASDDWKQQILRLGGKLFPVGAGV